jgi:hypothetical protein
VFVGKKCGSCGGPLVVLSSINQLLCSDCKSRYDWRLKDGQKSVLIDGLQGDGRSLRDRPGEDG